MLRKLLKYDFRSLLRFWWIAALATVALSSVGGLCISLLNSDGSLPEALTVLIVFALIIVVVGISVFSVLSFVLVAIRFYKNFFTDEGYLTFTLPVKRSQLLNSKLISGTVIQAMTFLVLFLDFCLMMFIGFRKQILQPQFWADFWEPFKLATTTDLVYLSLYLFELLVLIVLLTMFSLLFLYGCITFAAIITRKAKVITAIGIYYGANSVFSFLLQIFYLFGMFGLANWIAASTIAHPEPLVALILFGLILFIALFCMILYALQYWMLDRKLNLS